MKLREQVAKLEAKLEEEKKFLSTAKEICKSFQTENAELRGQIEKLKSGDQKEVEPTPRAYFTGDKKESVGEIQL